MAYSSAAAEPVLAVHLTREHFLVASITVAAFGPYLAPGVRTEQAAVYTCGILLLFGTLQNFRISRTGSFFFIPWFIYLAVAIFGSLVPTSALVPWTSGSSLAGLDNLFFPLVLMTIVWSSIPREMAVDLLGMFAKIVSWFGAGNALVAYASLHWDLSPLLKHFWSGSSGTSVADLAATMGRLGGIFNQPAEAGIFYSMAGILSVYAYGERRRVFLTILLPLISLGGILSVSKVFLLGGLPLTLMFLSWGRVSRRALVPIAVAAIGAVFVFSSGLGNWYGVHGVRELFGGADNGSAIQVYTAGRWNGGSQFLSQIATMLHTSPVVGLGIAGWNKPYDSGWTEALVLAGVIGVVCYALVLVATLRLSRVLLEANQRRLSLLFALLLIGGSLGIAPFTANRDSTIVWMLLSLLVLTETSPSGSTG